jgi:catechol 2,3-dioxygenase-like lactoylglutathione lyase family enzyme
MQLDHINIRTDNLEATTAFYRDVIGLEPGPRPPFPYPGAWLYHHGRPIVHLKSPGTQNPGFTGAVDHVAFFTDDLDELLMRIEARNLPYTLRELPDGSRRQCFVKDPNGVLVEINGR